ncbi:MAG: SoxR reducing system RseC family protein [Clostridiales bacterium]|jgi:sigma-E factor negative regulatory protein RseC|nr:SoxR reducing system RseC family protein [Clostridiales bacterium]
MEQVGQVIEVNGDFARVIVRRHDTCSKCGGCGVAIAGPGDNYVDAQNVVNAVVGQTVKVTSDTSHVLKSSFVVYMMPILALLAGIYAGQELSSALGLFVRLDIVLGLVLFFASYLFVRGYDKKIAGGNSKVTVTAIVEEEDVLPKDARC